MTTTSIIPALSGAFILCLCLCLCACPDGAGPSGVTADTDPSADAGSGVADTGASTDGSSADAGSGVADTGASTDGSSADAGPGTDDTSASSDSSSADAGSGAADTGASSDSSSADAGSGTDDTSASSDSSSADAGPGTDDTSASSDGGEGASDAGSDDSAPGGPGDASTDGSGVTTVTIGTYVINMAGDYEEKGEALVLEVIDSCQTWTRMSPDGDAVDPNPNHLHYNAAAGVTYANNTVEWIEYGPEHSQVDIDALCASGVGGKEKFANDSDYTPATESPTNKAYLKIIAVE